MVLRSLDYSLHAYHPDDHAFIGYGNSHFVITRSSWLKRQLEPGSPGADQRSYKDQNVDQQAPIDARARACSEPVTRYEVARSKRKPP